MGERGCNRGRTEGKAEKEKNTEGRKIKVGGSSLREETNWQKIYLMQFCGAV